MAMTAEKVQSVCESMERIIRASPNEHGYPCDNLQPSPLSQSELATLIFTIEEDDKVSQHLLYMLQETAKLVKEDRREKAMRWLGFVQGALWVAGLSTIEEMKDLNRPDIPD